MFTSIEIEPFETDLDYSYQECELLVDAAALLQSADNFCKRLYREGQQWLENLVEKHSLCRAFDREPRTVSIAEI